MKLYCKKCKKETDHIDFGKDMRPDRHYNCKICKSSNQGENK